MSNPFTPAPRQEPRLSIIVISPDSYATVRRTIQFLRRQTIRDRLELVFVAPDVSTFEPDREDVEGFACCRLVEYKPFLSSAEARAVGIRAARSSVVALVEDHCFPEPEWAGSLLAAHEQPWAGVGPAFRNANPKTLTSQANLVIEYGPWLDPVDSGQHSHIPGHNSSYKRHVLLQFGESLGERLEAESVMQWELQAQGHRFAIESRAVVRHENFARLRPSISLRFNGGRQFAANRAHAWRPARRLMFAFASPLIPFVRWWRCLPLATRANGGTPPWRMLPVMALLLACDAAGECLGYLAGLGTATIRTSEMEFHRYRFLGARKPVEPNHAP